MFKITKTNDNILDLVEFGDLVEDKRQSIIGNNAPIVYTVLENDLKSTAMTVTNSHRLGNIIKENIKSIYKRQPNGDYKRYEVE